MQTCCESIQCSCSGYVDEVIEPEHTRLKLIKAFKMLENKVDTHKKARNIPL